MQNMCRFVPVLHTVVVHYQQGGAKVSDTTAERLRCVALTKAGQPCRAFPSTPDGVCIMHSPRAAELHALGGKATSSANRAARLLPARMLPLVEQLETVFAELAEGKWDEKVEKLRIVHAMVAVAMTLGKLFQIGESEQRLRDLEAAVEQWQRSDRGRWSA
jgi:hypothetical protein